MQQMFWMVNPNLLWELWTPWYGKFVFQNVNLGEIWTLLLDMLGLSIEQDKVWEPDIQPKRVQMILIAAQVRVSPVCKLLHRQCLLENMEVCFKDTMSLLQPTSSSVELCRNYEYVMYIISVKFKR